MSEASTVLLKSQIVTSSQQTANQDLPHLYD